ncbi:hypothetical protein TNCV_2207231 [Trichonephila clavipes]|uniref:Uncharacterized protein n=1 Tax=Trichonephila clavipes TaxID=2585209 RepID=A0A8X6S9H6_TRICX|nr:hypothetical protein TNCV_2207231 [Trichonephila clavipes]
MISDCQHVRGNELINGCQKGVSLPKIAVTKIPFGCSKRKRSGHFKYASRVGLPSLYPPSMREEYVILFEEYSESYGHPAHLRALKMTSVVVQCSYNEATLHTLKYQRRWRRQ